MTPKCLPSQISELEMLERESIHFHEWHVLAAICHPLLQQLQMVSPIPLWDRDRDIDFRVEPMV